MQYYTYNDEYNVKLTVYEYLENLQKLFSKYSKLEIVKNISSINMQLDSEVYYNDKIVISINKKYFGRMDRILIHRRAAHALAQVFFSFDRYDNSSAVELTSEDLYEIFLNANGILDITDGQIYDEPIDIFFNGIKFSSDLISSFDIQNSFYFFIQFYEKLTSSKNFEVFNNQVILETGYSIKEVTGILDSIYNKKSHVLIDFMKENLEININETFNYWNTRKPELPIPLENRVLMEKPIVVSNEEKFLLCSQFFVVISIAKKVYHILRSFNAQKFGNDFGRMVEEVVTEYLTKNLQNNKCKVINLKESDNLQYGDFGINIKNVIFLFEIKSGTISLENKNELDKQKFKSGFDIKFVNSKGVTQQLRRLEDINKDYKSFCATVGLDEKVKYTLIPILLFLDEDFFCFGFNSYLQREFINKKYELNIDMSNIVTVPTNVGLTLNELKACIDTLNEPIRVFHALHLFSINYEKKEVYGKPFDFFVQDYYMQYYKK